MYGSIGPKHVQETRPIYTLPSPRLSAGLTVLGVISACALVAVLARQSTRMGPWGESRLLGGGIVIFFAFLPYEHTSDQILLVLPLMLLIGPDASGLREWPVVLATFLCVLTPLVLFHNHMIEGFNVLPAVSLLLAYALLRPGQGLAANPLRGPAPVPVLGGSPTMLHTAQPPA